MIVPPTPLSPFLLDKEVQHQKARHCERHEENSKQRNVWPPERLQTHHASTSIRQEHSERTNLCTETEYRQNRGSGHVQLNTVLCIQLLVEARSCMERSYSNLFELEVPQFIDSECLECSMEKRDGVEPLQNRRHRLSVDEQARKEEATNCIGISCYENKQDSLEQHDQCPDQTRQTRALECNGQQQYHTRSCQVEQHQREYKLPERGNGGNQPNETIHYTAKQKRWYQTQWKDIEEDLYPKEIDTGQSPRERTCLGREVGKRGIVPVRPVANNISIEAYSVISHIPLSHEQNPFVCEQSQARQTRETKQRECEEEYPCTNMNH